MEVVLTACPTRNARAAPVEMTEAPRETRNPARRKSVIRKLECLGGDMQPHPPRTKRAVIPTHEDELPPVLTTSTASSTRSFAPEAGFVAVDIP